VRISNYQTTVANQEIPDMDMVYDFRYTGLLAC